MYEQVPLAQIHRRPGPQPMCDWNVMAVDLREASLNQAGIVVNVPEGQSLEALRRSIQQMMKVKLGQRVGVSVRNHRSLNVWIKEDVNVQD